RGHRPARAGRARAAPARDVPGGARTALRRAVARGRRGVLRRRRVLRAVDAGHPAGAVADAGRVLARGGRGYVGAGVVGAVEGAGTNSAALQISDGRSNAVLLAAGGAAFAALGGGAVSHTATEASGSHPAAFAVVFLPMAGVALVGAWVTTRVRTRA